MPDPNSDLQSKLNRAIRALLIYEGAGSAADTIAAPSDQDRTFPLTAISTGDGDPFAGPGNFKFPVNLELRDEAVTQPTEPNTQATRVSANERLTAIVNAMTRSDDGHTLEYTARQLTIRGRALAVTDGTAAGDQRAADNADMADFTVLWWESLGAGSAQKAQPDGGTFWHRDLQFNCVACNSTLA